MPVRLRPPANSETEARIEIIPLIDIMFFLLAAFMLVSLSLVKVQSVSVQLPTATSAVAEREQPQVILSVRQDGSAFLGADPVGTHELRERLADVGRTNSNARVIVRGDSDVRHRDMVRVLDVVRAAGIRNVAFDTQLSKP